MAACPNDVWERKYVEPFFGAGSLFFALQPPAAILNDANPHLMSFYRQVRDAPDALCNAFSRLRRNSSKAEYYRVRNQYNDAAESAAHAARFLYLNRTCFNGIFRVNKYGQFNVPFGYKRKPRMPANQEIRAASSVLQRCELSASDFRLVLGAVDESSFVYIDPPYPSLSATSYFTHYTMDRFEDDDQVDLANAVKTMSASGTRFLLSNADTPLIRKLYSDFAITTLSVRRYITCKKKRQIVGEVLVCNY